MIDIAGLPKAKVLAALYNRSKPQGMGFLHFTPEDMTEDEATALIGEATDPRDADCYFDYVKGRVMKVRLKGDSLDERLYDRDNGPGAAESAIATLR